MTRLHSCKLVMEMLGVLDICSLGLFGLGGLGCGRRKEDWRRILGGGLDLFFLAPYVCISCMYSTSIFSSSSFSARQRHSSAPHLQGAATADTQSKPDKPPKPNSPCLKKSQTALQQKSPS
jgi:hypothetical protein